MVNNENGMKWTWPQSPQLATRIAPKIVKNQEQLIGGDARSIRGDLGKFRFPRG